MWFWWFMLACDLLIPDDVEALPQKDQRSPGLSHDALHEK